MKALSLGTTSCHFVYRARDLRDQRLEFPTLYPEPSEPSTYHRIERPGVSIRGLLHPR